MRRFHKKGNKYAGIDVGNGKVSDMLKNSVIEPLRVSVHELQTATETAIMILRIDDVIASKGGGGGTPPSGSGGMGDY